MCFIHIRARQSNRSGKVSPIAIRSALTRHPPPPAQVHIDRIGGEGDGIGHLPDGPPLYLPLTLPGERVTARPVHKRGDGWHAVVETIDTASPARIEPPCQHFGRCGGCVLQHWYGSDYRTWKAGLLDAALRAAGFTPPSQRALIQGQPGERRRLDFATRRVAGRICLGLHGSRSADIVDLTECLVLHPRLLDLIAPLRALLLGLRAVRRQASVVINLLESGPDLLLRSDAVPTLEDRTALTAFARAHGLPRVSWAHTGDSPSGSSAETICQLRPATTTFSGVVVRPPPGAFLQATEVGERAIIDAVLRGLPTRLPARPQIAEFYAGCGTLTFALAATPHVRIAAFEGDLASLAALRQAINQSGLSGRVKATQRDLTRQPLSVRELSGFAAVVLDPPHGGALAQIAQIAAAPVPIVVYVGCNPVTLARDAKLLYAAGYKISAATAIDQFLWSARLESVCIFTRD